MTTADTNLARLTALAGAGGLPTPGATLTVDRDFYVFVDGVNKTMKESAIVAMLAAKPELGANLPVVLPSEAAAGWKNPNAYGIKAAAPAAPPAPVAPPAPPAPPAPTAPSAPAVVPQVEAQVMTPADVATNHAVTVAGGSAMILPESVNSDAEADEVLRGLLTMHTDNKSMSIADAMNESAESGGMAHKLPISQLKKGNWDIPKQVDSKLAEHLPTGNRPVIAIYMMHRVGATGWVGSGTKGASQPPKWRFALPHPKSNPEAYEFIKEVTRHSRRVQMTPGLKTDTGVDKKVKFDHVGRMTLECHVLCWRPGVGFFELVVSGFDAASTTVENLEAADKKGLTSLTCSFEIDTKVTENKKVMKVDPTAKNAHWEFEFVKISADGSEKALAVMNAWREYLARDRKTVANTLLEFMNTKDYDGLDLSEVTNILKQYNTIPDEPRSR